MFLQIACLIAYKVLVPSRRAKDDSLYRRKRSACYEFLREQFCRRNESFRPSDGLQLSCGTVQFMDTL